VTTTTTTTTTPAANNYISASSTYLNAVDSANYEYRLNLLKSKNETKHVGAPQSNGSVTTKQLVTTTVGEKQLSLKSTTPPNVVVNGNANTTVNTPDPLKRSRSQTPTMNVKVDNGRKLDTPSSKPVAVTVHKQSSTEKKGSREADPSNRKITSIVKQVNASYTGNSPSNGKKEVKNSNGNKPGIGNSNNNNTNHKNNYGKNKNGGNDDDDEYEEETAELLAEERIYLANVAKKCNEWLTRHVLPYLDTLSTSSASFNNDEFL
jgi:hypothetical protein